MLFQVDPHSNVSIYEQIEAQVIFGIASGTLAVGELIPSIRDLGERLRVHPNTVAKAYHQLEKDGILVSRRGRGMEVSAEAVAVCRRRRQAILRERLTQTLREVLSSGLDAQEIRLLVDHELQRLAQSRNSKG
ncbi:MAG: GntR family transcriptional regulator [Gemmataceae bacterium]